MAHSFRVINGCPCPANIAPYMSIVLTDAKAHANSIYRGTDAAALLHKYGHSTQAELYTLYQTGRGNPANPPGFSTHELKSDGAAFPAFPRGADLPWWCQGIDVDDALVERCIAAAKSHGWTMWQPYPAGSEYHHLCFRQQPRPGLRTAARIVRLRATLPRS